MKRKLERTEEPVASSTREGEQALVEDKAASFADLDLDHRLLQALAQQKFQQPTLVQQKAIPLAISGRDVIAKAKTGSGKTLAYILPLLQHILKRKQNDTSAATTCLILVPSRELCDQVYKSIGSCASFCSKDVRSVKLSDQVSDAVQKSLLSSGPDIVISTPAKAWNSINASSLTLDNLEYLVVDEADLILSYGYQEELENVARSLPKGVQKILTSATLTTEVDTLKALFCRNPAVLDLKEPEAEGEGVQQYVVKCGEDEKFLIGYVIFKLGLLKGKVIVFVDDIDRCYRLKLFWEQFGIRSCILNSELPVNCRIHTVEEFNANVYDIIIASDENEVLGDEDQLNGESAEAGADGTPADDAKTDQDTGATEKGKQSRPKKKRKTVSSKDYGISRGIDFKNVACVVNFDLPRSSKSYTHRIGRTARAGQTGMALSFVVPSDKYRKHVPTSVESAEHDEKILAKIIRQQAKRGKEVKPYNFDMAQLENFRYRMNDALRAVTKVSIREARTRELRQELLKSEALKRHFEENPAELHHLRHDGELRTSRTQAHLRHVPDYLLPKEGRKGLTSEEIGSVPFHRRDKDDRKKSRYFKKGAKGRGFKVGGRKSDPLRTFKLKRKAK